MRIEPRINLARLCRYLDELAEIGALPEGGVSRLALSDADKQGRDLVVSWMDRLGLTVHVDQVGNIIGIRSGLTDEPSIMMGSHVDTVSEAGPLDGAYGVLAGLEVIQVLNEQDIQTHRPVAVVAFTNEEGARFASDMMGSRAFCGELSLVDAYAIQDVDGMTVGDELKRIGYAGDFPCGSIKPYTYIELHIEQGPVLDKERIPIGVVEAITGISWQEITVSGVANHAGTTPMDARRDAGLVVARIIQYLRELAHSLPDQRATCGRVAFSPGVINVIPGQAFLTVDLRNGDDILLQNAEEQLSEYLKTEAEQQRVTISSRRLVRVSPSKCHPMVITQIESAAKDLGYPSRRMVSGAGHDAQIMAHICPTGMSFIPSRGGISHSPAEYSTSEDLEAGANILLHSVLKLAG
jgi:N-carbamoyl-L-amino-acid hydrolase